MPGLISLKQLRDNPPPEMPCLWGPNWIVHPSLVCLAAEPKTGKSIFIMDFARALTDPSYAEFLGKPVIADKKRVLYLNQEVAQPGVFQRAHIMWGDERGAWEESFILNEARGIRLDGDYGRLGALVAECEADVVIIDPIARFHGWDESSNMQMGLFLNECVWPVVHRGRTVIMIHHFNKQQNADTRSIWSRIRGATRLVADPDSIFTMARSDEHNDRIVNLSAILRHGAWDNDIIMYRGTDLRFYLTPPWEGAVPEGAEEAADGPTVELFLQRLQARHVCPHKEAVEIANKLSKARRIRLDKTGKESHVWMTE